MNKLVASSAVALEPAEGAVRRLPGEAGVWILIGGDLLLFSAYFLTYAFYRTDDIALYAQSQATLNQSYGALNTALLLTSSLFVAFGVRAIRAGPRRRIPGLFLAALACGFGFGIVKMIEWSEKFRLGLKVTSNDFYMFYFMFTGIHFAHVLLGMGALVFMIIIARRNRFNPRDITLIECGASFWHMVDLLWIVLFALFYLMK
jgi:nitric oxide reductase NorE protein